MIHLKDKLAHLNYRQACALLGPQGEKLIRFGGKYDIDPSEQVILGSDLFSLNLGEAVVTIGLDPEKKMAETARAIEEATSLETPLLERNLVALSTIASIATMAGLLGTTIGMIRAFAATGNVEGGVIDATQLATGISEALVNTAGGLLSGILGIFFYNFFVNKVDAFNYTTDEATFEVMQILKAKEGK